jgi:short-subunit dehydrogenase
VKVAGAHVLVTGASSGIGAALAPLLAERGATVAVTARREDRLAEVAERCRRTSPRSRHWVADLDDVDRAEQLALEVWDAFGHLDVVVHNAAIPKRRHVRSLAYEEVERTMRVNFLSPARMTLALLPGLLDRGAGVVVNVASVAGRVGVPHEAAYCASKFALCGWSEALAIDLAGTGVAVRLVLPGPIDTEIWDLPDNEDPVYHGPKEPPSTVAERIVDAIEGDAFEHYVPDLKAVVDYKTADIDGFLAGAATMGHETGA